MNNWALMSSPCVSLWSYIISCAHHKPAFSRMYIQDTCQFFWCKTWSLFWFLCGIVLCNSSSSSSLLWSSTTLSRTYTFFSWPCLPLRLCLYTSHVEPQEVERSQCIVSGGFGSFSSRERARVWTLLMKSEHFLYFEVLVDFYLNTPHALLSLMFLCRYWLFNFVYNMDLYIIFSAKCQLLFV